MAYFEDHNQEYKSGTSVLNENENFVPSGIFIQWRHASVSYRIASEVKTHGHGLVQQGLCSTFRISTTHKPIVYIITQPGNFQY